MFFDDPGAGAAGAGAARRRGVEHGLRRRLRLCRVRWDAPRLRDLRVGDLVRLGRLHVRDRACLGGLRVWDRPGLRQLAGPAPTWPWSAPGRESALALVACGSAIGLAAAWVKSCFSPLVGSTPRTSNSVCPTRIFAPPPTVTGSSMRRPVHERAVRGAQVLDLEMSALEPHSDVAAGHFGIVDRQVGVLPTDDQFTGDPHRLTRARSAYDPKACHSRAAADYRGRRSTATAKMPYRGIPAAITVRPHGTLLHALKSWAATPPEHGSMSPTSC